MFNQNLLRQVIVTMPCTYNVSELSCVIGASPDIWHMKYRGVGVYNGLHKFPDISYMKYRGFDSILTIVTPVNIPDISCMEYRGFAHIDAIGN